MKSIDDLRKDIDVTDDAILALLSKRAEFSLQVKQTAGGTAPLRRGREATIINRMVGANQGPFSDDAIRNIFESIVYNGRNLQGELRVSYLGPEGTYSETAARTMFGQAAVLVPKRSLIDVIRGPEGEETAVAVLPIENSTEGGVTATHKLLLHTDLPIIAEYTLPIRHALLSKGEELAGIKTIYGHPQALGQCRDWLATHVPDAALVECASNTQGLELAKDASSAAIAGEHNSVKFDMNVLETSINDEPDNATRFVALSHDSVPMTGDDKTSIFCTVHEKSGALHDLLGVLSDHNISMTRLESQPHDGGYGFFIDFVGHKDDEVIATALTELASKGTSLRLLGSYPRES